MGVEENQAQGRQGSYGRAGRPAESPEAMGGCSSGRTGVPPHVPGPVGPVQDEGHPTIPLPPQPILQDHPWPQSKHEQSHFPSFFLPDWLCRGHMTRPRLRAHRLPGHLRPQGPAAAGRRAEDGGGGGGEGWSFQVPRCPRWPGAPRGGPAAPSRGSPSGYHTCPWDSSPQHEQRRPEAEAGPTRPRAPPDASRGTARTPHVSSPGTWPRHKPGLWPKRR